ncbi:MAG: MFS transporter, partial [Actinobacteria bacterium]|nr:MFS transporter [Actinomycetota bacterium]
MNRARAYWLLCGATLFEFIALGIFLAGLPLYLTRELHSSRAVVGLTVGAFSVSALALRPVVGRWADRRGRKPFLVAAPIIIAISAVGLSVAHALPSIVALRVLQGVAGAAFYTSAATVATDLAPAGRRAEYISRFSLFLYGGFAIGPTVAEWAVKRVGFDHTWLLAGASALVALVLSARLPETRPSVSPEAQRGRLRLVHPAAVGPGLVLMTAAVGYVTISTFSPLYARHIGMASSGPLYLAFSMTVIGVRLVSGRIADRLGPLAAAVPGILAAVVGLSLLALTPGEGFALVGVMTFGAGFALLFPALMTLAVDRVGESERGEALGSTVAFFDVGSLFGGYLVGAVADHFGFGAAFLTPAALALCGG